MLLRGLWRRHFEERLRGRPVWRLLGELEGETVAEMARWSRLLLARWAVSPCFGGLNLAVAGLFMLDVLSRGSDALRRWCSGGLDTTRKVLEATRLKTSLTTTKI